MYLWRYNRRTSETLAAYTHCTSKQQLSNALMPMTLWQSIFLLRDFQDAPTITAKIYKKGPSNFGWGHQTGWKCNVAQHLTATMTPSTVSMMSGEWQLFCLWTGTGHFGCHCWDAPSVMAVMNVGHFAQGCSSKIPPSGTPCHQDRSHWRHQYIHNTKEQITLQLLWSQT